MKNVGCEIKLVNVPIFLFSALVRKVTVGSFATLSRQVGVVSRRRRRQRQRREVTNAVGAKPQLGNPKPSASQLARDHRASKLYL